MIAKDFLKKRVKKSMRHKARVIAMSPEVKREDWFIVCNNEEVPRGYDIVIDFENKNYLVDLKLKKAERKKMKWIKFSGFKCEHCDTLWIGKGKKCPDCGKPMIKIEAEAPYGENFFQQFFSIKNSPIVVPTKSPATHQISLQKQLSKIPG